MSEAVKTIEVPLFSFSVVEDEDANEESARARAREYLGRVSRLNRSIDHKIWLQQYCERLACREPGFSEKDLRCLPGGAQDRPTEAMIRAMRLEKEIDREQDQLYDIKEEIRTLFVLLDRENPMYSLLLDDRYLKEFTVSQVADRNGYCERHTKRLLRRALLALGNLLAQERPMQGYVSPLK